MCRRCSRCGGSCTSLSSGRSERSRLWLMSRGETDEFAGVFDVIDAGLIVLDSERRVRAWNEWMTAGSSIPADEARGRRIEEIFPQVSSSRLRTAVTEALDYGVSSVVSSSLNRAMLPLRTRT